MSPFQAGLILAPMGLVFAAGAVVAPFLVRRFAPAQVLAGSFLVTAVGYVLIARLEADTALTVALAALFLFCAGLAPFGTLTTDLVMRAAPPAKAGAASGLSETSFEFGAALGVAVLGSILTAVYRARLDVAVLPAIAPDLALSARETLAAALLVAEGLDGDAGLRLADAARNAFTDAMQSAAWVSALLAVGTALICATRLRITGPAAGP
jgi:DHA2 family multidrug resistance protein-like MFS transporter